MKRLCQVAGRPDDLKNIRDFVNLDAGKAWLKYEVDGTERDWPVQVDNDWVDGLTISYVMQDL